MIKAAKVGVIDHMTHIPKVGVSSRILIDKAAPELFLVYSPLLGKETHLAYTTDLNND
jgi:hypothetical protein